MTLNVSSTLSGPDGGLFGRVHAGLGERQFHIVAVVGGGGGRVAAVMAAVAALLPEDGDNGGASFGLTIKAFLGGTGAMLDANIAKLVVLDSGEQRRLRLLEGFGLLPVDRVRVLPDQILHRCEVRLLVEQTFGILGADVGKSRDGDEGDSLVEGDVVLRYERHGSRTRHFPTSSSFRYNVISRGRHDVGHGMMALYTHGGGIGRVAAGGLEA